MKKRWDIVRFFPSDMKYWDVKNMPWLGNVKNGNDDDSDVKTVDIMGFFFPRIVKILGKGAVAQILDGDGIGINGKRS